MSCRNAQMAMPLSARLLHSMTSHTRGLTSFCNADIKNNFSIAEYDSIFARSDIHTHDLRFEYPDSAVRDDWHSIEDK